MQNTLFFEEPVKTEFIDKVAKYAPILTPLAPAAVLVAGMYVSMFPDMWYLAIVPAVFSGAGMEGTGYLSSHLLIKSIRRRDWLAACLSVVLLGCYACFAVYGISQIKNAQMFEAFVAMSITCYLAVGLYTYNDKVEKDAAQRRIEKKKDEQDELLAQRQVAEIEIEKLRATTAAAVAQAQAQAAIEHEKTLQARAEARRAKVQGGGVRDVRPSPNSLNPERLALFVASYKANPAWSIRQHGKACGVSSSDTASRYLDAAKKLVDAGKD